jgi:BirA family transcriptional regulator, biotin operon repressor / biotin---[acetyl-CoA-carboxylase] ligase
VSPNEPDRAPLRPAELRRALLSPGSLWTSLEVVAQTGSTNDDLLAAARLGAAEGSVLVAEQQTSGRGRQGRAWTAPARTGLLFSLLLRPAAVPPDQRGWLPLLTGVAVARAVNEITQVGAVLKWPNDVLVGPAKLAGILAEQADGAIVVGVGLNVAASPAELPPPRPGALPPTSLALLGAYPERGELIVAILREFERWYRDWASPDSLGLREEYLRQCATIGRDVRVELPGGAELRGAATGIDPSGRLVVAGPAGPVPVSAGDVIHLR